MRDLRRHGVALPRDGGMGFWPLVSIGAILGGTMGSPLTGIVFAVELTHDLDMRLPLVSRSRSRTRSPMNTAIVVLSAELLKARARHLEDEQRRERILPFEYLLPPWLRSARPGRSNRLLWPAVGG